MANTETQIELNKIIDNSVTVAEPIPEGIKSDPTALTRHLDGEAAHAAENAKNNYIITPH